MTTETTTRTLTGDARWQAVLDRDITAEGTFFYAVHSTGVYCRPTCPSRRPTRSQVSFFETTAEAAAAGFRACRRCHPDDTATTLQLVARLQAALDDAEASKSLAALAAEVGVSASHLARVFKRETGQTPHQYAAGRRLERLKDGLKQGQTVTDAMYDAGYGSSRSLYESASKRLGMTPSAYRNGGRGVSIAYGTLEMELGTILVAASEHGVCRVRWLEDSDAETELRTEFPQATLVDDAMLVQPYLDAVKGALAGQAWGDVSTDAGGTEFQHRVWAELDAIPMGQTRTYGQIAELLGRPGAARAVGRACATNPIAVLVPCHRVVASDGALTGYRWGVERKQRLLDAERAASKG